jgi:hypothetical protein
MAAEIKDGSSAEFGPAATGALHALLDQMFG